MKNRRLAIIAFVLVAVMAIGVGYAELSNTLKFGADLGATANTEEYNDEILFTDVKVVSSYAGDISDADWDNTDHTTANPVADVTATQENDYISVDIPHQAFNTINDTVTITATITNNSDVTVYLDDVANAFVITGDTEYFVVSFNNTEFVTGAEAADGATFELEVTIKLNKTPTESVSLNIDLGEFTVTTTDPTP